MNKTLSLVFAVTAILLFIGVGILLSYRMLWLAVLLLLIAIVQIGVGFIIKARLRR